MAAACAAAGALTALLLTAAIPSRYQATAALVMLSSDTTLETRRVLGAVPAPRELPIPDAAMEAQPSPLVAVAERAAADVGAETRSVTRRVELIFPRPGIVAAAQRSGRPIRLSVVAEDGEARRAQELANAYASAYVSVRQRALRVRVADLEARERLDAITPAAARPSGRLTPPTRARAVAVAVEGANVQFVRPAALPAEPVSPRILRDVLVAALLGFALSLTVTEVRLRRRGRIGLSRDG